MATGETSTTPTKAYSTPVKRSAANADAGPSRKPQGASPAYSSRRHSLYGIEDRIVIDPGSRIWKVGFSGEPDPRAVFWSNGRSGCRSSPSRPGEEVMEIWDLDLESLSPISRKEASRLVATRITKNLREVFSKHLLTDSKSRKVIIIENTFLPDYVKEHIAEALFENLKVPSISFTSSALLSLNSCGRITGLVVDCGWLETTVTPVYYARPLYHLASSTSLAGRTLHRRLKVLLRKFATYYPPPPSIDSLERRAVRPVPEDILADQLIERVITELLFVGGMDVITDNADHMEVEGGDSEEARLDTLRESYERASSATDIKVPITMDRRNRLGPGYLLIPGWIRERAAEVLFEPDEDEEADSIHHCILKTLLKLPVDIRPTLASSMLVTGGTASLPGFIPRLRISLKSALLPPPFASSLPSPAPPLHTPESRRQETIEWRKRGLEPYKEIYGLVNRIAILNDPAPIDGDGSGRGSGSGIASNAGSAPRWVPSLMSWVGGSLAGMLKTGSPEILREEYDTLLGESIARGEAYIAEQDAAAAEVAALVGIEVESLRPGEALSVGNRRRGWKDGVVLRDWSKAVLTA